MIPRRTSTPSTTYRPILGRGWAPLQPPAALSHTESSLAGSGFYNLSILVAPLIVDVYHSMSFLRNSLDSAALKLPGRDAINVGLGLTSVAGLAGFCVTGDPTLAALSLGAGVVSSGALGLHMTASIGGADMPVVITLLNSYSGWALCAEGDHS